MWKVVVLLALVSVVTSRRDCRRVMVSSGVSMNFNETVGHAIHSMTVQGLKVFSPKSSEDNGIPTVVHGAGGEMRVRSFAPSVPLGSDFRTHLMNAVDMTLSNLGKPVDGLGDNWSPLEQVVHNLHMWDLWTKINDVYLELPTQDGELCECLLDTRKNGIYGAVQWIANHYKTGTPISLLNRPIPKLVDEASWGVWKGRLLYYYTPSALRDAAIYLKCAIGGK